MNVTVCIKRTPDTETRIRVAEGGTTIDSGGVKYVISPYDEFALEAALKTREATGDGEVRVVTLGEAGASEQLRSALAMGADRAVLLEGQPSMDGLATAKALVEELRGDGAQLYLFGVKAVDDDQQQVGPMVAQLLGVPCVTSVSDFSVDGESVTCTREVEGGSEVVELDLPAVITVTKGAFEPRYASLKGIMAAKKKPLDQKSVEIPAAGFTLELLSEPPARPAGRIVGEGLEAVPELVALLREEAKVL